MSISTRQYAQLAQHSYDPPQFGTTSSEKPYVEIDGIKFAVIKNVDKPSGYQGTIFQREDTGEMVVAHRGSEFDRQRLKDGVLADGGMVAARANLQLDDALALVDEALAMSRGFAPKYGQAPQVTITGHSLGGCLGQLTAAKRGLNGEMFNPYGAASLNQHVPEGGIQVINHVMAGDVVSAGGKHFGKVQMYAEPVDLKVLKAVGYEDNGSQFDIRNPLKGAIFGGDSHRMHHFLDVDADGRPDRSVLARPETRELAEKHRPMFDKYRNDIYLLREGLSIGTAAARGAAGIGEEVESRVPLSPRSPFKDAQGEPGPSSTNTVDPRIPGHPDHSMYRGIREGISALDPQHGLLSDETSERTAASLLVAAKQGGLRQVDHIVASSAAQSATTVFAVEGDLHDPVHKRAGVSVAVAAQTPLAESFHKLDLVNQQHGQAAAHEQSLEQTRSAASRSV